MLPGVSVSGLGTATLVVQVLVATAMFVGCRSSSFRVSILRAGAQSAFTTNNLRRFLISRSQI